MTYFAELRDTAIALKPLNEAVKDFTQKYVTTSLLRNGCHMQRTAGELGIHRNTLTRVCKEVGIRMSTRQGRKVRAA
jgi:DNA-binding NtrC family response regulator